MKKKSPHVSTRCWIYCRYTVFSPLPGHHFLHHLTQSLWSGYILTCKDGRWVGAGDLIMPAVARGGMLAGNGGEIRAAGSLLGRWDRDGWGGKPSTLAALSAPMSTTNPLFSPSHSKYMFSPLWRQVKKLRDHDWGSRKTCGFPPGEFRRKAMTGFVKKP